MQIPWKFGSTGVLVLAHESVVLPVCSSIRCPTIWLSVRHIKHSIDWLLDCSRYLDTMSTRGWTCLHWGWPKTLQSTDHSAPGCHLIIHSLRERAPKWKRQLVFVNTIQYVLHNAFMKFQYGHWALDEILSLMYIVVLSFCCIDYIYSV